MKDTTISTDLWDLEYSILLITQRILQCTAIPLEDQRTLFAFLKITFYLDEPVLKKKNP